MSEEKNDVELVDEEWEERTDGVYVKDFQDVILKHQARDERRRRKETRE